MAKKKKDDEEQPEESSGGSIPVNDAWTGMLAISLLALLIGTGFLAYDYLQYYGEDYPKVPKLTTSTPGVPDKQPAPPGPPPKVEPKDDKKDDKQ